MGSVVITIPPFNLDTDRCATCRGARNGTGNGAAPWNAAQLMPCARLRRAGEYHEAWLVPPTDSPSVSHR